MNKLFSWLAVIAVTGFIYWCQPDFFRHAYKIIEHGNIGALAEYLRSFGPAAIFAILVLFVVMTFTIVFPFALLEGAVGIIYGVFWAVMLSWVGEVLGAIFMFVFARFFFRKGIEGWVVKSHYLKQMDDFSAKNGFKALLVARLVPLAPSGIITAVAAISRISFRDFMAATILGKLPPIIVKVLLGYDLAYAGSKIPQIAAIVVLVGIIYGGMWWWNSRRKKQ